MILKFFAWFFSVIFNPIFLNILGYYYFTLEFPIYVKAFEDITYRLIYGILIFTFFIPLSILSVLQLSGKIRSFTLENRNERTIPYILFFLCFAYNFYDLKQLMIPGMLDTYALISASTILFCMVLNLYIKVSAHAAAAGGLLGFMIINGFNFNTESRHLIALMFIICGLIFWSRLYLKAHHPKELIIGFGGGLIIGLFTSWLKIIEILSY